MLDTDCKAHEVDNLYVVDTSFFPSIGAVNPALTAMANALRVGDHLAERLPSPQRVRSPRWVTVVFGLAPMMFCSAALVSPSAADAGAPDHGPEWITDRQILRFG